MKGKREVIIVVLSVFVIAAIFAVTSGVVNHTNAMMTQYCFDELDVTTRHLAKEIKYVIDNDTVVLKAMSKLISTQDELICDDTFSIMSSFGSDTAYISDVEMLLSDGTVYNAKGETISGEGYLDFDEEVKKGTYLSGKETSAFTGKPVLLSATPVEKDGNVIAMLYGVVELARLAEVYKTDIYDGRAYVYIIDGATGDFLLDTWHKSLSNITEMGDRETIPGKTLDESIEDIKAARSGSIGFVSKTIGSILYMRYCPIGVNLLSVMVTIEEEIALERMRSISGNLYGMAVFDGVMLLVYMTFIVMSFFVAYRAIQRLGFEDQMTGLQNRIAYDSYVNANQFRLFDVIACVYIDANGLHEINNRFGHDAGDQMLKTIAEALKKFFPEKSVYRIGGDEFVVLTSELNIEQCESGIQNVVTYVAQREYTVSTGFSWRENELGTARVTLEADERMLADKRKYYQTHERRTERQHL